MQFCYTVSMWRGTCHAAFAGWAGENPTQALAVFLRRCMQQPVSQHMPYSCRLRRRAGHATLYTLQVVWHVPTACAGWWARGLPALPLTWC